MNDPGLGQALHGGLHYENFPVASWLLPKRMRQPVLALYAFARTGDDLADEGDLSSEHRLQGLRALLSGLTLGDQADPSPLSQIGARLGQACGAMGVSSAPAARLIEAFQYDAAFRPFKDWPALDSYCDRSASPVGRMVLAFAGLSHEPAARQIELVRLSDAVCCGLQMVNFAQDFGQDLGRHRPTLPQEEWPETWCWDPQTARLQQAQPISPQEQARITLCLAQRGLQRLQSALCLPSLLRGSRLDGGKRLGLEIALTIAGGCAVARRVLRDPIAPWHESPRLSRVDMLSLLPQSLWLFIRAPGPSVV